MVYPNGLAGVSSAQLPRTAMVALASRLDYVPRELTTSPMTSDTLAFL
jgi:hypothetical protein